MTEATGALMHWVDDYAPCFCGKVHGQYGTAYSTMTAEKLARIWIGVDPGGQDQTVYFTLNQPAPMPRCGFCGQQFGTGCDKCLVGFTLNQQTGETQMYSAKQPDPYQGLIGQQRVNAPMPATMPSRTVGERIDEKINEAMGTVEHYQRLKQRMAGCLEVKVEDIIELGYRL